VAVFGEGDEMAELAKVCHALIALGLAKECIGIIAMRGGIVPGIP